MGRFVDFIITSLEVSTCVRGLVNSRSVECEVRAKRRQQQQQ